MNKKSFFFGLVIVIASVTASLASVVIFCDILYSPPSSQGLSSNSVPRARPASAMNLPSFEDAAELSINAVVHVKSEFLVKSRFHDDYFGEFFNFFFGRPPSGGGRNPRQVERQVEGFGSGVVISSDGYIITNNHVVQGAEKVEITFNNKRVFPARIVGTDPRTDLALLKVEADNLEFLTFGNSDQVRVGEWVLAVGNPFNLNSTVTAGIVSARARNVNILSQNMSSGEQPLESFIQTDAAVNRGNSGGALVNLHGELIGINTAIASTSGTFTGYSFAIPANIAKKVSEDLRTFGQVQRAFLGVQYREIDQEFAIANNLNSIDGLSIALITETGAATKAGLRLHDVLLKIDGKTVNTGAEFLEILGQHRPGETIELTYSRNGRIHRANAILQDRNGSTEKPNVIHW